MVHTFTTEVCSFRAAVSRYWCADCVVNICTRVERAQMTHQPIHSRKELPIGSIRVVSCDFWGGWCAIFRISRILEYSNIRSEKIRVLELGISVPTFSPIHDTWLVETCGTAMLQRKVEKSSSVHNYFKHLATSVHDYFTCMALLSCVTLATGADIAGDEIFTCASISTGMTFTLINICKAHMKKLQRKFINYEKIRIGWCDFGDTWGIVWRELPYRDQHTIIQKYSCCLDDDYIIA